SVRRSVTRGRTLRRRTNACIPGLPAVVCQPGQGRGSCPTRRLRRRPLHFVKLVSFDQMLKFYTQVFADAGTPYFRMAEILQRSGKAHGVDITINVIHDTDEELEGKLHGTYYQNCRKTKHHNELIQRHQDGDVVVLLDADML